MYLESSGELIYYEVNGPEKAPAVIFTHGGGLNSGMFNNQVNALKDDYRIVTWDLQGHGRSSALESNLNVPKMADYLVEIMDELNIEKAVLVGQSLGTYVNQVVALNYSDRVSALVSIGGLPIEKPMSRLELFTWRVLMSISKLLPEKMIFKRTAAEKTTTAEAEEFFKESVFKMGKKQFLYMLGGQLDICTMDYKYPPRQPLLITHGQHEMPKYLIKANKEWHANIPGSIYYEIPEAGHNANQDNPEFFNKILLEFLDTVYEAHKYPASAAT